MQCERCSPGSGRIRKSENLAKRSNLRKVLSTTQLPFSGSANQIGIRFQHHRPQIEDLALPQNDQNDFLPLFPEMHAFGFAFQKNINAPLLVVKGNRDGLAFFEFLSWKHFVDLKHCARGQTSSLRDDMGMLLAK